MTWTNQAKNSGGSFANQARSYDALFGNLSQDQIGGNLTFNDDFQGKPLGNWAFDDEVTLWSNQTRHDT